MDERTAPQGPSDAQTAAELAGAATAIPVIGASIVYGAQNETGFRDYSTLEQLPGVTAVQDHASSFMGGYAAALGGVAATEWLARRVHRMGYQGSAEKIHRMRNVVAALGSVAYQAAAESNQYSSYFGTGDAKDAAIGVVSTIPGILAGNMAARKAQIYDPSAPSRRPLHRRLARRLRRFNPRKRYRSA